MPHCGVSHCTNECAERTIIVCKKGCGTVYCCELHREHDLLCHDHAKHCCPPKPCPPPPSCPHAHGHHNLICTIRGHHHEHTCYDHGKCGHAKVVLLSSEPAAASAAAAAAAAAPVRSQFPMAGKSTRSFQK